MEESACVLKSQIIFILLKLVKDISSITTALLTDFQTHVLGQDFCRKY